MTTPPIIARAHQHAHRLALVADDATLSYRELLDVSAAFARSLLDGEPDLDGGRVAFLVPPGAAHVATQWAVWRAGGIAVPLAVGHPPPELAYVLDDAEPVAVVAHPDLAARVAPAAVERGIRVLEPPGPGTGWPGAGSGGADAAPGEDGPSAGAPALPDGSDTSPGLPAVEPHRPAMMIYTSGTTGRPKGVVTTHATIAAQIRALVEAWAWTEDDRILGVLPLHHVHGVVNVVSSALWSGACCELLPRFDATRVWELLGRGHLTLFMAVPTIYARLIEAWDQADEPTRTRWSEGAAGLRLMVSGSAALPVGVLERWRSITGHTLLERYGMTEIGMGLGNPLEGPRRPGHVGRPFPGVEVRLVDDRSRPVPPGTAGEIQVRGAGVFREYWRRPDETAAAFQDGWFRTGDVGVLEGDSYRILGRSSVDIIKTGGEKISALEVEETLREHPGVADCAVVGVADPRWGEVVCAAMVPASDPPPDPELLQAWARERLAPYKVPRRFSFRDALPRNAMGKVTKPAVRQMFAETDDGPHGPHAPPSETPTP